ncbi:hypothetical protein [Streptomyces sp. NBC_00344]|uniref:hypothetical protein n=1 Tax=Streptomyces sp. NBC_00344 TaxID=2975720 RepID=UPI002E22EC0B
MTGHRRAAPSAACAAAFVLTVVTAGSLAAGHPAAADNGLGSLSADQISRRAHQALFGAGSLHISTRGNLGQSGTPTTMDLSLDRAANCRGAVGLGKQGSVEIIKRGQTVWIKPDRAFWKHQTPGGDAAASMFAGQYLKGSAKKAPLKGMAQVCDLDAFLEATSRSPHTTRPALTKGRPTKIHGVSVIPVSGVAGHRTETLYVATEGKPYPVQLSVRGPSELATVRFTDFGKPVSTKTPPADRTIDLSTLGRRSAPVGAA